MASHGSKMQISVWGPATWTVLHAVSFALPDEDTALAQKRDAFCGMLRALARLLPCAECREHMAAAIRDDPPERHLDSAEGARRYVWALHNQVNRRCGKGEHAWEALCAEYGEAGGVCPPPPENRTKRSGALIDSRDRPLVAAGCVVAALFASVAALSFLMRYASTARRVRKAV